MRILDSGKWVLKQFFFETFEELAESRVDDVVVGYIGTVAARLRDFNQEILTEKLRIWIIRRFCANTSNVACGRVRQIR